MQFQPRVFSFYCRRGSALFAVVLFFLMASCGGGNAPVSEQSSGTTSEAFIKASIFSSVPQGGGSVPCSITCEFSYTAGASGVIKAQGTFSSLSFKCDANGVPESGQGIDTQFTFDPNDPDVLEGGTVEVSCGPSGASIIDNLTFNFFNDSIDFIAQECINGGHCTLTLELTSLKDQVNQSGLLNLLSNLQCPSLDLADKLFCSDTSTSVPAPAPAPAVPPPVVVTKAALTESQPGLLCDAIESARVSLGCISGSGNKCGNNQLDEGEQCDGTILKNCSEGASCIPPNQPNQCTCQNPGSNSCGNGLLDHGEICDGNLGVCQPGTTCGPECTCVPEAVCTCDGVRCPPGMQCDMNNNCTCAPSCTPTGPTETNCTDGLDNDCDGSFDCDDSDCSGDPACTPPPPPPCVPTGPEAGNCTDGIDNDCNGSKDCADSACAHDPACAPPPPPCVPTGPEAGNCTDHIDNDCNGSFDCNDSACFTDPACAAPPPPPR